MARYIDADALKESLKKLKAKGANRKYVQGLQDAIDGYFPQIIDDMPTAEVQPIKHGFKNIDYSAHIDSLKQILDEVTEDENSVCYVTDVDAPALRAAINVLKAVVLLDKESEDEDEIKK